MCLAAARLRDPTCWYGLKLMLILKERSSRFFLSVCSDVGRRKRRNGEALKAVSSQTSKNRVKFFVLVEFTRRNTVINDRVLLCGFDT